MAAFKGDPIPDYGAGIERILQDQIHVPLFEQVPPLTPEAQVIALPSDSGLHPDHRDRTDP